MEQRIEAIEKRVDTLEKWKHDRTVADAIRAEQAKHIDERFDQIEKKVDKGFTRLDGMVARVVWLIIGTLLAGVIGFIIKGGLNIG